MKTVYLDNAATSFPKPACVAQRMAEYVTEVGATINRSVYGAAQSAGLVTFTLRERLAKLFSFDDPKYVILTAGNTMSLNMVINGYLKPGDHCIVSSVEHNAVMRPLQQLAADGVSFDRIPCDENGLMNPVNLIPLIRENTKLVIVAHASNVGGGVQDIESVGEICRRFGIPFVVDAAQTAGHYPINFKKANLSALCVPGHKGLMGPQGIGVLIMKPDFASKVTPLIAGGTGSASDTEIQPEFMPDRFESGTANMPGIYGLEAALEYIENIGIDALKAREDALTERFLGGIADIKSIRIAGPQSIENRVGVISIDFVGKDNGECAYRLEEEFGILTRCGLHCAPSAHRTLGTFPQGVVRFSVGWFTTEEEVDLAVGAIRTIACEV